MTNIAFHELYFQFDSGFIDSLPGSVVRINYSHIVNTNTSSSKK